MVREIDNVARRFQQDPKYRRVVEALESARKFAEDAGAPDYFTNSVSLEKLVEALSYQAISGEDPISGFASHFNITLGGQLSDDTLIRGLLVLDSASLAKIVPRDKPERINQGLKKLYTRALNAVNRSNPGITVGDVRRMNPLELANRGAGEKSVTFLSKAFEPLPQTEQS